MTKWSLPNLLQTINAEVERTLSDARRLIGHEGEKGGASEEVWRTLFRKHLPLRYQVDTGFVVDSEGHFSKQLDLVVFDRQYSPLVFQLADRKIFPAESVYAVFEAKQSANAKNVRMARDKATGVKRLVRTNLPIRNLDGRFVTKNIEPVLGGLLSLESDWKPPLGDGLFGALRKDDGSDRLDMGCIAAHGIFSWDERSDISVRAHKHPATIFLLELVARLQELGTVPMIDMAAYSRHLP